jgi:hypothetical protein
MVIDDYAAFLKAHPEIETNPELREKGRHAFAFTISASWPIYINLDDHRSLLDAYAAEPRVAAVIAGVLTHEYRHATGVTSEAEALQAELEAGRHFRSQGLLPASFDLEGLERQYNNARVQERRP